MDKNVKEVKRVNVRAGDKVLVIAGKCKGKSGKVEKVIPETNRCVVTGINMVIKHKKARSQTQKSERKETEGTIDISNVMIICPKCDKATRVSHAVKDNVKHRVCKKCGEVIDKKYVKPKKKDVADDKKEAEGEAEKKTEKKPLVRREVKHTAESIIKKPAKPVAKTSFHRNMGGE
jgi:large subunit ribosomal protein L24